MRTNSRPDWWQRRRVVWPLTATLLLTAAALIALARSDASRVVVYNETGSAIPDLTITTCGQSRSFRDIDEGESVRIKLAPTGSESDIAIATNGVPLWRGDYIEPRGGYRAIVHLRRDGEVEATTTLSWWQGLLGTRASSTP